MISVSNRLPVVTCQIAISQGYIISECTTVTRMDFVHIIYTYAGLMNLFKLYSLNYSWSLSTGKSKIPIQQICQIAESLKILKLISVYLLTHPREGYKKKFYSDIGFMELLKKNMLWLIMLSKYTW